MTKTSAIFGVVSVLTAAIVGGVFIRKKIIDDALYWKAWAAFEAERKRKIRSVEEEINALQINIKTQNKSKENINKNIEKYEKDIKELAEEIKKYEEKIKELKSPVNSEKIRKIDDNLTKQTILNNKVQSIGFKTQELQKQVFNPDNEDNSIVRKLKSLTDKLESVKEFLSKKEVIISAYVDYKVKNNAQLKAQEKKKNEKLDNKEKVLKELENDKSLFISLTFLMKTLQDTLNKKNNELSILKQQTFKNN